MPTNAILHPLRFQGLELKNRIIRASLSWRYDGAPDALPASLDWELRFARAGVGAVISAVAEVHPAAGQALEVPAIHRDIALGRWTEHVGRIHAYRCKYIVRIGHEQGFRQLLPPGQAGRVIRSFAEAAGRVRETGADGVEIQAVRDAYINGESLIAEISRAVRHCVGYDFHVQVRLDAPNPVRLLSAGTLQLARLLETTGVDAIHLTADSNAARLVKDVVQVPVLRNGRFETAESICCALSDASCDAISLTRPLVTHPPSRIPPERASTGDPRRSLAILNAG